MVSGTASRVATIATATSTDATGTAAAILTRPMSLPFTTVDDSIVNAH